MTAGAKKISHRFHRCHRFILDVLIRNLKNLCHLLKSCGYKVQSHLKFKVKNVQSVKTIDFRALTAITLFMLALLFSLPNLVIAIVLMILISALLEIIKMLAEWQPKKQLVRRIS